MKKLAILATAFVLAASAANAESVTINHQTAGDLKAELVAAIAASETLTSYADITELTITGEAVMNATDFAAIRANLRPSLLKLDMSQAKFTNNRLPGGDGDKEGILNKMNLVEVKLPETLTTLSGGVFFRCRSLEKVNLPDGIKSISQYCFSGCSKLKITALPPYLTSILADAFRGCASLELTELPETIKTINGDAFNDDDEQVYQKPSPGIAFTKLPRDLETLGARAFRRTSCSFSEWPEKLTTVPASAFAATKCTFSTIPDYVTSVGELAFQSVKTLPEFTIPNVGTLWTKLPKGLFYVNEAITRSFICRAPEAPAIAVATGSNWDETFGRPAQCGNTTLKVLASAKDSYSFAPYTSMKIEVLKTAVPEPVIEMPVGHDAANINVKFVVNNVEHSTFDNVLEGEGKFVVSFGDAAHEWLHVQEISYVAPEVYAEGEEETGDADEETDPNVLYRVGNVAESLKKTIEVPVTVTPDMKPLHVVVAMADVVTGVDRVNVPDAVVTRDGDIVNLTVPGATLYDLAGRLVLSTDTNTLDLGSVPAGVYVLRAGKKAVKIVK